MGKLLKRLSVLMLCVALVMSDSAISGFAAEVQENPKEAIDTTEESNDSYNIISDELGKAGGTYDESSDGYTQVGDESEEAIDEIIIDKHDVEEEDTYAKNKDGETIALGEESNNEEYENVKVNEDVLLATTTDSNYFGGSGTSIDPYIINSKEELLYFAKESNKNGQYYKLNTNISLNSDINNPDTVWKMEKTTNNNHFDGNGYLISNVWLDNTYYTSNSDHNCGFFGSAFYTVDNLTINNVLITGEQMNCWVFGKKLSSISKCNLSGNVTAKIINTSNEKHSYYLYGFGEGYTSFSMSHCNNLANTIVEISDISNKTASCTIYGFGNCKTMEYCSLGGSIICRQGEKGCSSTLSGAIYGIGIGSSEMVHCSTPSQGKITGEGDFTVCGIGGYSNGEVKFCDNNATLSGKNVYGLFRSTDTLYNSNNYGDISAKETAVGLTETNRGAIGECNNYGNITANEVYGIAKESSVGTTIRYCVNEGNLKGKNVYGIAGKVNGGCTIERCNNKGTLSGEGMAYGLFGTIGANIYNASSQAKVINCYNEGQIIGCQAAGVCGFIYSWASLSECYNVGDVIGELSAAGICDTMGYSSYPQSVNEESFIPSIEGCYNVGKIKARGANGTASEGNAAGLVNSIIKGYLFDSFNAGNITGVEESAGLVTCISSYREDLPKTVWIGNCFNAGQISTNRYAGGLVSTLFWPAKVDDEVEIYNAYNIAPIYKKGYSSFGYVGTVIGNINDANETYGYINIQNVYSIRNDNMPSVGDGNNGSYNFKECTETELQKQETYTQFDFDEKWYINSKDEDYPYPMLQGIGHVSLNTDYVLDSGVWFNLSWKIKNESLILNGNGLMPDLRQNESTPWNEYNNQISTVVIGEGITSIGDYAFYGCSGLTGSLTIPNSVTSIGDSAFYGCSGLTGSLTIPSSVISIGYSAFYGCSGLTGSLTIPNSVTSIGSDAFYGCSGFTIFDNRSNIEIKLKYLDQSSLVKWYDKATGKRIDSIQEGTALKGDANGPFAIDIDIELPAEPIKFDGEINLANGKAKINFDSDWLGKSSYTGTSGDGYDHNIAIFSAALSTMVYESDDKYASSTVERIRMFYNFRNIGFDLPNIEHNYFPDTTKNNKDIHKVGTSSPAWIVNKKVLIDGEEKDFVFVVIRGTSGTEWINNFFPGTGLEHEGFKSAAEDISKKLEKYINDNNIDTSNMKLLITGHSRGAAVANMMGRLLDDQTYLNIDKSDIFVYTFATPNVAAFEKRATDPYNNIYNIINPEDFVTKVLPSQWGYSRYGNSFIFPTMTNDDVINIDFRDDFNEYFKKYYNPKFEIYDIRYYAVLDKIRQALVRPRKQTPYSKGFISVNEYVNEMAIEVGNIYNYYSFCLDPKGVVHNGLEIKDIEKHSMCSLYVESLGYFMAGGKYGDEGLQNLLGAATGKYGDLGVKTAEFFAMAQGTGMITGATHFEAAHMPETYLAMLHAVSREEMMRPKTYKRLIVSCPVDVIVYDSNGDIYGKVVDNVVDEQYNADYVKVEGESKQFYLFYDDYDITFSGNGEGTMDYSVIDYDADAGEISRVVYENVPLSKGKEYYQSLDEKKSNENCDLLDANNNVIEPTLVLDAEQLGQLTVEINCFGRGFAGNIYNLTPGDWVTLTATPNNPLNEFIGWYDEEGNLISEEAEYGFSITESKRFTAKFTDVDEGIWATEVYDQDYSGKAIKPEIKVYDGDTLLTEKVDYTIAYANNVKAYTLSEEDEGFNKKYAPTITITGKGNYASDKEVIYFKILPSDLSSSVFVADDITLLAGTKAQKPIPKLLWNGKTLDAKGNYSIKYFKANEIGEPEGEPLTSVREAGKYIIRMEGLGTNFVGTKDVQLLLTADKKLASKLSVAEIKTQSYTGEEIKPALTVKDGKTTLIEGTHYTVKYQNNIAVGKATAIVTGIGDYVGTKTVTFKIAGTAISKATVKGISSSVAYTGNSITFDDINVYIKATKTKPQIDLDEGVDYNVSYQKNVKAGTGTVVITGVNGYTGVIKKTFKITPYKYSNAPERITATLDKESVEYSKGGAKPGVTVEFTNSDGTKQTLTNKTDYTVTYLNNTAVNDQSNSKKLPTVKITLKGSYSGTVQKNYSITPKDIALTNAKASDKTYSKKKGAYKSTVKVTDTDGKVLVAKKDYNATITYELEDGTPLDAKSIVDANKCVVVTVKAKEGSNYSGTVTCKYRITQASIGTPKVTIASQVYTGKAIELKEEDITIKPSVLGDKLVMGQDYEIVPGSYVNNIKKGTASVVIRGINNYGGTRKVDFTIKAKGFRWWWR